MTLVQLANFVRMAELQSLSKAAAVIRIAQPALSRQLRHLEIELGAPLVIRHAWGVSLTAAGEALLARARRVLLEAEGARDAVQALADDPAGRVALGVPTSLATILLPELSAALRDKYPRLRPHFVDGFSAVLHARTLAGDLDLAALYDDRAIGPLATSPLLSEDLALVGPMPPQPPGATAAEMLAKGPLILPARPNRLRLIVDEALSQCDTDPPPFIEVDSLPAIIRMVRRGAGFTVLPYSTVVEEVTRRELSIQRLEAPQFARTLLLVRPVDRQPTPAVAAVEQEIRSLVRQLADKVRWAPLPGGT
jgi:LysR family nitrogen assimilation transcriptional regulator